MERRKLSLLMGKFILTVFFACIATLCRAQSNEPRSNLGKTISELRQVFPNVRYMRTETKGDFYTGGEDPTEGLCCFF